MVKQPNSTLNSWKEIAVFFDRGVRTVQRWERELGLPVHRVRGTEHSPVFAYLGELELWLRSRSGFGAQRADGQKGQAQASQPRDGVRLALQRSRELIHDLTSQLIEERKQTETLVHSLELTVQALRVRRTLRAIHEPLDTRITPADSRCGATGLQKDRL